jgi:hypothetical protein
MEKSLDIYKEDDMIIIANDLDNIELPYSPELWWKLNGEKTYDEDKGWLIDGIEIENIIKDENDRETENMFIGTIQADGIDERRELFVVKEGESYRIVGIDPAGEREDTEIISENLKEVILNTQEIFGSEERDLQLSDEADELLKETDELKK